MPIDTSMYANIAPIDPLGQVDKFANASAAITGARSAQFDLAGRMALGRHIQDAIDPGTGQVDTNKLAAGLKSDPNAAGGAATGTDLGLAQRQAQLGIAGAGINLNQQNFTNLSGLWAARLAQGKGPIDPQDLQNDVIDATIQGRITPDFAKSVLRTIPPSGTDARAYAAGGFISALPQSITAGAYPAPPGAGGAPRQQSGGQFVAQTTGTGGAPDTSGTVTTGLPPGASEALGAAGTASANMGVALTDQANSAPDRKAALRNMLADVSEFTGGPVSEQLKTALSGVNEVLGTKFNLQGIASQEEFDKQANQIVQQQADALGVTDQRERTAMGANPNSKMSTLGIKGNIALLMGNEDAKVAKAGAWQKYLDSGGTPDHFGAWANSANGFNKNYDPRVFQFMYLSPADQKKVVGSMSPTDRATFSQKYNFAIKNGWTPDPRKPNAQ